MSHSLQLSENSYCEHFARTWDHAALNLDEFRHRAMIVDIQHWRRAWSVTLTPLQHSHCPTFERKWVR